MKTRIREIAEIFEDKEFASRFPEVLNLDELNWNYFVTLHRSRKSKQKSPFIYQKEQKTNDGQLVAYPTAIAPLELLKVLPVVEYKDLLKEKSKYEASAQSVFLWLKKMHAGTGSTLVRNHYLANMKNIEEKDVILGAKGTDLFIKIHGQNLSLAEVQILQGAQLIKNGAVGSIAFHDIVSPDTKNAVSEIWNKSWDHVSHFGSTTQEFLPTLDQNLKLTINKMAPAGHAFAAMDALLAAGENGRRPTTSKQTLLGGIGNGEDLSSTPDPIMVGWMRENKIPIAMLTTDKTAMDLKGGQISLVKVKGESPYVTIIEQAQAKAVGQLELFEKIGLETKEPGRPAMFNTNVALFNYEVLVPEITRLIKDIGAQEFMKICAPDVIENWKIQKDKDAIERKYLQVEGAMGSTLLNLDRYWRMNFGEPLVHFINIDEINRTQFFSPIKTAFDFFMQFHSNRFSFDVKSLKSQNLRLGSLPQVSLEASDENYYQELQNILEIFKGTEILDLDKLEVQGKVDFSNSTLRGQIKIVNKTGKVFSLVENRKNILQNENLVIE